MKEATGELNATVFVVIAVASLVVFFYTTIWPAIRNNLNENTACSRAICAKWTKIRDLYLCLERLIGGW